MHDKDFHCCVVASSSLISRFIRASEAFQAKSQNCGNSYLLGQLSLPHFSSFSSFFLPLVLLLFPSFLVSSHFVASPTYPFCGVSSPFLLVSFLFSLLSFVLAPPLPKLSMAYLGKYFKTNCSLGSSAGLILTDIAISVGLVATLSNLSSCKFK